MIVTHKTSIDFTDWSGTPCFSVVEGDQYSRNLECTLLTNGKPFVPPESCTVVLRYRKPDHTGGVYDTMPDGSKAWALNGNILTLELTPQLFTVRGTADLFVTLIDGKAKLNSFKLQFYIQRVPRGLPNSQRYINVDTFIPHPQSASVGQFLKVTHVDEDGRVTVTGSEGSSGGGGGKSAYEYAVDGGYSGTEEEFAQKLAQENLVTCDLNGATEDENIVPINADTLGGKRPDFYANSEMYYKAGDSVSETFFVSGYITSSTKGLRFFLPLSRPVSADYAKIESCNAILRGTSGYLDSISSKVDLTSENYTRQSADIRAGGLNLLFNRDKAFSNVSNNTPIGAEMDIHISFHDEEVFE